MRHLPRLARTVSAIFLAVIALTASCAAFARERPTLRVLSWPGYADADVVRSFEKRHEVRVEVTLVASDTVLWEKMSANGGADFDVFAVNTAELQRYIDQNLAQAVDPAAIPNTRGQLPRFRKLNDIRGLTRQGKVFGIPYTYAEMGLIYDRTQLDSPPDSITVLWDPRFRGRILAYNGASHNFSLAALSLGSQLPFTIAEPDWPRTVERLIDLRRNVLAFYTQPDEAAELFRTRRAALLFANYGMQQVQLLRTQGADIGYVVPREGALAWLDCWAVSSGARDRTIAHAWINHLLEPEVSKLLVTRQGLSNTVSDSGTGHAEDRLIWLEPVEDVARREKLWGRVVSGDRAARVLAP